MDPTLALAKELIARQSITPHDAGCQALLMPRLAVAGFESSRWPIGDVNNLWSRRGVQPPLLTFVGHTDVVPPGPLEDWDTPPFEPRIKNGFLYGRGAADMKGSIAAMVVAVERFVAAHPRHRGSIGFLITSDEEGPAVDGTAKVVEKLQMRNEQIDWCLVGEPSSVERLGDMIKIGRRGSLSGELKVHGIQGHVAYPHQVVNPIHQFAPALTDLSSTVWDTGNESFAPTSFQISNLNAGTGATNVVPGVLHAKFNFRFSTQSSTADLISSVESVLNRHGLTYDLTWKYDGQPFLTRSGKLCTAVTESIYELTGINASCTTEGGTSDGRFIAPTGAQVVELGPVNKTIHKLNECVEVIALKKLSHIYERILEKLLLDS